jgi:hypothetical protein
VKAGACATILAAAAGLLAPPGTAQPARVRIELSPDAVARAGLETAPAEASELTPEEKAYGRVLDPLPLIEPVLARTAARRLLEIDRIELRRVEGLRAHDRNASEREVEAARLAVERATLDLRSASARVSAAWGGAASGDADLDALVEKLAGGGAAIGRLDLPPGLLPFAPGFERIQVSVAAQGDSLPALVLGPAPSADPVLQGPGYLIVLDARAPIGAPVDARLPSRERIAGLLVPAAAVVWFGGQAFVFVEAEAHVFERRAIERLGAKEGAWVAAGDLVRGDRLVIRGAEQLLSQTLFSAQAD